MKGRSRWAFLPVALAVSAALVPAAQAATTLNVIPHGQTQPGASWLKAPGVLPADAQAKMYDRLTPLFRSIGPAQLVPSADGSGYFKSAELRAVNDPAYVSGERIVGTIPGGATVGADIKRDAYGVPYIFSDTDAGATFAAGYVTMQDRGLLVSQARRNGVAGLIDIPNVSAIRLVLGLYDYKPTQAVLDDATKRQTDAILAQGAPGAQLLRDIDIFLAGMNAYQPYAIPPITRTDIYALNAIKGQFLGEGGGSEVFNSTLLDALQTRLGRKRGAQAYDDLRARNDPETSTTTDRSFPYQTKVSASGKGVVVIRDNSFRPAGPKLPAATAAQAREAARHASASNVLIASGRASASGVPELVGGPQIGYNYPGLTLEMQISSPSIQVRGATSAPFPGYMLIGRGTNFAWTLTSAGADIIDTYAETLCGGSRTKYLYKGKCTAMENVDAGTISQGAKTVAVRFLRTVHGPVIGYARTRNGNRLVALSRKRSSYGRDTVDQLFFQQLTYGRVKSAADFVNAAKLTPQTFNSFYASATEAAMYTSGALPLRPRGANPDLPTDGRGGYEWRGELAATAHPQVVNPASGLIVNWNNKPARDFPPGDDRFGNEGSLQRVDLLEQELAAKPSHDLASLLAAANAGATQDVRIVRMWPVLKRVLARGKAPSALSANAVKVLDAWQAAGGSRVDADLDGKSDDPGVAVMDAVWDGVAHAAVCPPLGRVACAELELRNPVFDAPPDGQRAGWHQYMHKDLRRLLGERVRGAYKLRYCGSGRLRACATSLWRAFDKGLRTVSRRQGSAPAKWRAATVKLEFTPIGLTQMQYTNRPSGIHQVMQFGP